MHKKTHATHVTLETSTSKYQAWRPLGNDHLWSASTLPLLDLLDVKLLRSMRLRCVSDTSTCQTQYVSIFSSFPMYLEDSWRDISTHSCWMLVLDMSISRKTKSQSNIGWGCILYAGSLVWIWLIDTKCFSVDKCTTLVP